MKIISLKLSVTTCYLVRAGEKYLLVDTGYEEDRDLFQKRMHEAGVSVSEIGWILLTHHHDDHCGLLHFILQQNPEARVVMSERCRELILRGENDRTHGGGLLNRRVAFLIRHKQDYVSLVLHKKIDRTKNLKFRPYECRNADIVVSEETNLRGIGIPLDGSILFTPGHTVDSVSLLFSDGDCLVGDAAAHMLPFAGTKYCVIFVCSLPQYYRSWVKLLQAGALRIFPAHGDVFPAARLLENIGKNRRENMVISR